MAFTGRNVRWNNAGTALPTYVREGLDASLHVVLLRARQPRALRHSEGASEEPNEHRLARLDRRAGVGKRRVEEEREQVHHRLRNVSLQHRVGMVTVQGVVTDLRTARTKKDLKKEKRKGGVGKNSNAFKRVWKPFKRFFLFPLTIRKVTYVWVDAAALSGAALIRGRPLLKFQN